MSKLSVVKTMADVPYILESSEFRTWVNQKVTEAKRLRDDLANEVTGLETEIQARMSRIADMDEIIQRGEAALTISLPVTRKAPTMQERDQ